MQWYQKLYRSSEVLIEACENFTKQTYRNRCLIATAQGVQALTVPVVHDNGSMRCLRISDHGNWRHQHWQALTSAYGDSPFLEYYEDDLRPFFSDHQWELLFDYNEAIRRKMCELLDIHPRVSFTHEYIKPPTCQPTAVAQDVSADSPVAAGLCDYREAICPKHPEADPCFAPRPYYQVFASRHGFLPNMSILDLLLNMGPEAIFYL